MFEFSFSTNKNLCFHYKQFVLFMLMYNNNKKLNLELGKFGFT